MQRMYVLGPLRRELSALNVQHQITTANVLHDEVDSRFRLKTGVEVQQERMAFLVSNKKYPLL